MSFITNLKSAFVNTDSWLKKPANLAHAIHWTVLGTGWALSLLSDAYAHGSVKSAGYVATFTVLLGTVHKIADQLQTSTDVKNTLALHEVNADSIEAIAKAVLPVSAQFGDCSGRTK